MASKELPKLTYFSFGGRAQAIRWCFQIYELPFIDDQISVEWFSKARESISPTGSLPVLKCDGSVYGDTLTILNVVASMKDRSLLPAPEHEVHAVDIYSLTDSIYAALNKIVMEDPTNIAEAAAKLGRNMIPDTLEQIERLVSSSQDSFGHTVSRKLTWVDLVVAGQLYNLLNPKGELLDMDRAASIAPSCFQTLKLVLSHTKIVQYQCRFEAANPIFTYFAIPARGEAIRLILKLGNIKYEDRILADRKDWTPISRVSPTGQLPLIEFDDKQVYVETYAIVKHVGERTGLTPITLKGRQRADEAFWILANATEFWRNMNKNSDPAKYKKEVVDQKLPDILRTLNQRIATGSKWITGDRLTWIDIYVASQWRVLGTRAFIDIKEDATRYPRIAQIYEAVYALPAVVSYINDPSTSKAHSLSYP
eukprot:Blabericola_migrator_1__1903@NODE_1517_length_4364_cov_155_381662_g997_i0_p2_GENE_NODE_1517_length_4364_cov_155_381662_g997_i0NODE_1517_length_4364_cov_155_381662_g997_i0_p2_ORF_typecomplete_len423_score60_02GST_C_3/PF14497_6/0_0001GST_C_3/PF14497_6/1_2e14GST_N/PF02798_20/0_00041GST_N/PF02798_20/1_3e06GST_N_3/PF13417_6/0_1GST_N_3/PF13417_6/0_00061GST_C/PF00043_25/9_3e02GST_C/PF00043_25/7_1e07Tom37/PF10568_9/0_11Tom37/PF10568_9/0_067Tom37/PF10568_9/6_3e03GST_N_4/PF17172_4/0_84GST_N_4/PF17172_4/0_